MNKDEVPKQGLEQKHFHEHYCSDTHNSIQYRVITLIDSADTLKEPRRSCTGCINKKLMRSTIITKGMPMKGFKNSK